MIADSFVAKLCGTTSSCSPSRVSPVGLGLAGNGVCPPEHTGWLLGGWCRPASCSALSSPHRVPQHCFMMPQSLGVIGGKPNSAHYFIGYVGEWWVCGALEWLQGSRSGLRALA